MAALGEHAPDFDLEADDGRRYALKDFLARGPLVLFFYPKDDTLICTKEACSFRDRFTEFEESGAALAGVSSDSKRSHQRFVRKFSLNFPLLSDPKGRVRDAYGVRRTLGFLPGRETFVIDRSGIVRHRYRSPFRFSAHVDEALAVVRDLHQGRAPSP